MLEAFGTFGERKCQTVLRLDQTPRIVQSEAQKRETKCFPLLETMAAGSRAW